MAMQPFVRESWIEYAIGSIIVFLRIYARSRRGGFRSWQGDDYLIIFAYMLYTLEAVLWHEIGKGSAIKASASTPPALLAKARLAMKYNFIVWIAYTTFIWTLKACLLFLYHRLCRQTKLVVWVKVAAWLVALSYIAGILELFLHCRPFQKTWILYPYPGVHCASGHDNFIAIGSMNFLTDLVILAIPIPLLWKVRLPWKRKIMIGLLLFSGVFILIATALRNILGYKSIKGTAGILNKNFVLGWAVRENFVSLVVVNAPCIKPLFSKSSWFKLATHASSGSSSGSTPHNSYSRRPSRPFRGLSTIDRSIMATMKEDFTVNETSAQTSIHLPDDERLPNDIEKQIEGRPGSALAIHKTTVVESDVHRQREVQSKEEVVTSISGGRAC